MLHGNIWDKYTIYRKERNKYGGGVAILVKEEFVTLAYDNNIPNVKGIACKCVVGDLEVVLCCIYKQPNVSLDLYIAITNYIDNMGNSFTNSRLLIFGDFNYPNINWLGQIATANENVEINFLECLVANNLNQIIDFLTWANNILDLVLCKDGFNSTNASVISPLIHTNPEYVKVTFEYITNFNNTTKTSNPKNYCFPQADFNSINNYLSNINWYLLFSDFKVVEDLWTKFINKLKEAIDLYVPCKKQAAAKYMNKPVPNFIRKLINKKRMLWSKFKKKSKQKFKTQIQLYSKSYKICYQTM